MSSPHTPKQNHVLAALPEVDYARLLPDLELTPMPLGWAVYESGGHMGYVYFPTTSIVSLLYVMQDGASAEIAITGNEGVVGISLFMGGESTPSRAVVQSAGNGYRLRANVLRREFALGGHLQHLALRYTQALITQMAQTAVCNRHHRLDQQLCRRLLVTLDRLSGDELVMTQELIANMLGVRREGVTEAAGKLHADGLIDYRRGHIKVLDRAKLEKRVCECYAVVKKEYDRLLPYKIPGLPNTTTDRYLQADDDRWILNGNQSAVLRVDLGADLEAPLVAPALATVRSLMIRGIPVAVAIEKILELTRGFLFRDPVLLLISAGELIAPAGGLTLWIIGEPAPLFFHFPAELLPVASKTILIHLDLLLLSMRHVKEAGWPSVRLPQRCCSASELAFSHPVDNFCF